MKNDTDCPIWLESEVVALMEEILIQAIATLADGRAGPGKRLEILYWIESDAMRPFSFRA